MINDEENGYCLLIIAFASAVITLILVLGIKSYHETTCQAGLDAIKVRAGLPTSDAEARITRLEKALESLSREFRPTP